MHAEYEIVWTGEVDPRYRNWQPPPIVTIKVAKAFREVEAKRKVFETLTEQWKPIEVIRKQSGVRRATARELLRRFIASDLAERIVHPSPYKRPQVCYRRKES